MKSIIKYFAGLFLLWLLFFAAQRYTFLLFERVMIPIDVPLSMWFSVNRYALGLDVSAICYLMGLPLLFITAVGGTQSKTVRAILFYYWAILLVASSLIFVTDLGLYKEWGSKFNHKALSYLAYPKEAASSLSFSSASILMLLASLFSFIGIFVYAKKLNTLLVDVKLVKWQRLYFFFLLVPINFLGIRGGWQTFPINRGWGYYSVVPVFNHAAVNSTWNFIALLAEKNDVKTNPYKFFDEKTKTALVRDLYAKETDSCMSILKTAKPNIVIVLLESWSADAVGVLGDIKNASPEFDKLTKEGLLFTHFYATGFRTEQGLAAINAGFPSQPKTTIIRKYGKFEKLPSLARVLMKNGYHSSYIYGGNLEFANTRAYLRSSGYEDLIGEDDWSFKERTNWGAMDKLLFDYAADKLAKDKKPFFSIIMTSTSHEPFDAKVECINGSTDCYCNVLHYTDKSLGAFVEKTKKNGSFDNTLFIFVADHANRCPKNRQNFEVERHWIPCLMLGGALKDEFKGKVFTRITSHADLPNILLSQLNIDNSEFHWGKNTLNYGVKDWAYYSFDEGFGLVTPNQALAYDIKSKKILSIKNTESNPKNDSSVLQSGKAMLQKLMDEFILLNQ